MIEVQSLGKSYRYREVLKNITIDIDDGEIFSIIGPSGSGKTTLLKLLDLVELHDTGTLTIFGVDVSHNAGLRQEFRRRMAMLFQKPVMFNRSVVDNVALGLIFRRERSDAIDEKVHEILDIVGLTGLRNRNAKTLSGGEAQRVALARALITEPEILFLDEPTANLDPETTEQIEALILRLNKESGTTIVMATHDLLQGQRLSDRIAVLVNGEVSQVGIPYELFRSPKNTRLARYVGIENIIEGVVISNEAGFTQVRVGDLTFSAVSSMKEGEVVHLCFRGEAVAIDLLKEHKMSTRNVFDGTIKRNIPFGPFIYLKIDCGPTITALVTEKAVSDMHLTIGQVVSVHLKASSIHVIPAN